MPCPLLWMTTLVLRPRREKGIPRPGVLPATHGPPAAEPPSRQAGADLKPQTHVTKPLLWVGLEFRAASGLSTCLRSGEAPDLPLRNGPLSPGNRPGWLREPSLQSPGVRQGPESGHAAQQDIPGSGGHEPSRVWAGEGWMVGGEDSLAGSPLWGHKGFTYPPDLPVQATLCCRPATTLQTQFRPG